MDVDETDGALHLLPGLPVAHPVPSRLISHVGYDADAQRLVVVFRRGGQAYCYGRVDDDCWAELCTAESLGRYFGRKIVDRYPYRKVGDDPDLPADAATEARAVRLLVDRFGVPLLDLAERAGVSVAALRACYIRGATLPPAAVDALAGLLEGRLA